MRGLQQTHHLDGDVRVGGGPVAQLPELVAPPALHGVILDQARMDSEGIQPATMGDAQHRQGAGVGDERAVAELPEVVLTPAPG